MATDCSITFAHFPASLDGPETKPQEPDWLPGPVWSETSSLSERFRHSGWSHNRSLVYDALRRTNSCPARITAFDSCGWRSWVYQSVRPPYDYKLGGSFCRDRLCVPCARDRSLTLANNVLRALPKGPNRFLTLTLKQRPEALALTLTNLYAYFRTLRRTTLWRDAVLGGCAFLEIKWAAANGMWNVHLHSVVHGKYVPQRDLSAEWLRITGDSMITDVRIVKDSRKVARYVTKYVSKPLNNTFLNRPAQLDEFVVGVRARRLCFTFGDWRGLRLTAVPEVGQWIQVADFDDVLRSAAHGDPESVRILRCIFGPAGDHVLARLEPPAARAPPPKLNGQCLFDWAPFDSRF